MENRTRVLPACSAVKIRGTKLYITTNYVRLDISLTVHHKLAIY